MINLITELGSWIDRLSKISEKRADIKDESIKAFRQAVIESKIYINELLNGQERNRSQECTLARFWFDAARILKKDARINEEEDIKKLSKECDDIAFIFAQYKNDLLKNTNKMRKRIDTIYEKAEKEDRTLL